MQQQRTTHLQLPIRSWQAVVGLQQLTRTLAAAAVPREELAGLNRSIQSTAKAIKSQLEGLNQNRAALPEPQQAKLRKLMQDFAATLQVGVIATMTQQQQQLQQQCQHYGIGM